MPPRMPPNDLSISLGFAQALISDGRNRMAQQLTRFWLCCSEENGGRKELPSTPFISK